MTSDSNPPAPPLLPRPSVFISYASEDRAPTRLLREALAAAGLEVWYDENELGGGDAWDQKIRRQIRECTYFMPVVSATTERRREGYFRREWRLATERSLDMADDVMFLVPVVIDETAEMSARVPEKFLTVQWLRLPGGQPTPGLAALAQRLLNHGDTPPPPRSSPPPAASRPPLSTPAQPPPLSAHEGPGAMPPFPHRHPDAHQQLKYFAEVIWWVITAAWLIFKRLPRWVRILLSLWIATMFVVKCSRDDEAAPKKTHARAAKPDPSDKPETDEDAAEAAEALRSAASKLDSTAAEKDTSRLGAGFARAGAEIARAVSDQLKGNSSAKAVLGVIPFDTGITDETEKKVANEVFENVFSQLALARPGLVKPLPVTGGALDDSTLQSLAVRGGDNFLLVAQFNDSPNGRDLSVRLMSIKDSTFPWSGHFATDTGDNAAVATQIAKGVLETLAKP